MELNFKYRYARVSPTKARIVANAIKGMKIDKAEVYLELSKKKAARIIKKLLDSAVASALENHQVQPKDLVVKNCRVDRGPMYKRWRPRAMGRATMIRKRTSHITLTLQEKH